MDMHVTDCMKSNLPMNFMMGRARILFHIAHDCVDHVDMRLKEDNNLHLGWLEGE